MASDGWMVSLGKWWARHGGWQVVGLLLLSVGLWVLGWQLHLGGVTIEASEFIYGDKGDGFFNLWVLEHVRLNAPGALGESGIFWPQQACAYFWSDNLLVPGLLYRLLYPFPGTLFTAYMHTAWLLHATLFVLLIWFFREVVALAGRLRSGPARWAAWLCPLLAYAASFSQNRIMYIGRFQTLSSACLVLLVIAGLRYLQHYRRRDLILLAVAETLALYSAPYYALLGGVLILVCGGCLLTHPGFSFKHWFTRHAPWGLLFFPSAAWIVIKYQQAGSIPYSLEEVARRSLAPLNLVVPLCGWSRVVWERCLGDGLSTLWAGGFMGSGVIVGSGLAVLFGLHWLWGKGLRGWQYPVLRACLGEGRALLFLSLALVTALALASGPSGHGPSLLECCRLVLPCFASIREPIRFTPLAQTIWMALLFVGWLRLSTHHSATVMALLLVGVLGLQLSETVGVQAKTTRVFEDEILLSDEEQAGFATLSGSVWMVPSVPLHHNVRNQFFLQALPNLITVNGYSGRSSALFSQLMQLEATQGRLSDDQLALVKSQGVTYLVVVKYYFSDAQLAQARQQGEVILDLPRFLVLNLQ